VDSVVPAEALDYSPAPGGEADLLVSMGPRSAIYMFCTPRFLESPDLVEVNHLDCLSWETPVLRSGKQVSAESLVLDLGGVYYYWVWELQWKALPVRQQIC
jgi:hypothetical protein